MGSSSVKPPECDKYFHDISVFHVDFQNVLMTPLLGRWWNGYSGLPEKDSRKLAGQTRIISAKLLLAPHFAAGWCCRHLLSWTEHTSLLVQIQANFQSASKILWKFVTLYSEVGGSTKLEK